MNTPLTLLTALLLAPLAALHAAEMPKPVNKPNIVFLLLAFQAAKATPGLDNVSVSVTATTAPAAPPAESGPRITVASSFSRRRGLLAGGRRVEHSGQHRPGPFQRQVVAGSLEIPYADALGAEVNAESARALGRDLAQAVLGHLTD